MRNWSDFRIFRAEFGGGFIVHGEAGEPLDYNGHACWTIDAMVYDSIEEARQAIERFIYGHPATMVWTAEADRAYAEAEAAFYEDGFV